MQELPRSASKQQEQQDDRGPMPMAVMEELAHRLVNVDQRGMNGTSVLTIRLS